MPIAANALPQPLPHPLVSLLLLQMFTEVIFDFICGLFFMLAVVFVVLVQRKTNSQSSFVDSVGFMFIGVAYVGRTPFGITPSKNIQAFSKNKMFEKNVELLSHTKAVWSIEANFHLQNLKAVNICNFFAVNRMLHWVVILFFLIIWLALWLASTQLNWTCSALFFEIFM